MSIISRVFSLCLIVVCVVCVGCGSRSQPYEDKWELRYQHSAAFMWEQIQFALSKHFRVAEEDFESRKVTTDWNEHLSVMSHHGYRERLIVTLDSHVAAATGNTLLESVTQFVQFLHRETREVEQRRQQAGPQERIGARDVAE